MKTRFSLSNRSATRPVNKRIRAPQTQAKNSSSRNMFVPFRSVVYNYLCGQLYFAEQTEQDINYYIISYEHPIMIIYNMRLVLYIRQC